MPTATRRPVRATLTFVCIPLALCAGVAPTLCAQVAALGEVQIPRLATLARDDDRLAALARDDSRLTRLARDDTPDTSQCDLIDADRPGIADGSHVIGAGQLQLETGYLRERHPEENVRRRLTFVPTLLRIGLTSRVEARLEGNTFSREHLSATGGSATNTGLSPLFLGAKIVLYDPKQVGPLQVATIVRVAPPSGTDEFRTDRVTGDVRLVADWQFAPTLSLNPNVGWAQYEGDSGARYGTAIGYLTLSWQPTSRWNPFVDVAYQSREDAGGTWAAIADAGVSWLVGCDLALDLSAGQNLHGFTAPKPFVAAGISVRADLFHRATHPLDRLHGDRPTQSARL
ncbi:MAG: transporter [Gemmatimonadetes bacterium]|nr:transporter [Gemmatimonadota bacterium]